MTTPHTLRRGSAGGGGGTLPVTDTDTTLYRGGVDLLKTDDSLHVVGTTRALGGVQNGNFQFEKTFNVSFDGVADRRADIYLAAASTAVIGAFDVTISSSHSTNDANGVIRVLYFLAGTNAGVASASSMTTVAVQGAIAANYALMPITWDAVNLRWRIPIGKLVTSTAGIVSVSVRYLANNATRMGQVRDGLGVTTVYTEAGTVTPNAVAATDLLGDALVVKSFLATFTATANEKADLYFPASTGWTGVIEVTLTSNATGAAGHGVLVARYSLGVTSTGTFTENLMSIVTSQGSISGQFGLTAASWDATNSRVRIQVVHRGSAANPLGISVRMLAPTAANVTTARALALGPIYTTDATVLATNQVETVGTATGSRVFGGRVAGQAVAQFYIRADGLMAWGNGTNAVDTWLYRDAALTLKTDDALHIGGTLRHLGASAGFFNAAAVTKPTVTGSRADGTALASLLTALANLGLITNSTTA